MNNFRFNKIIREKPLKKFKSGEGAKHVSIRTKKLSPVETREALIEKLHEEVDEIDLADSKEQLTEECADLYEVIETLCQHSQLHWKDVERAKAKKIDDRGRIVPDQYVEYVTLSKDDPKYQYFMSLPARYPVVDKNNCILTTAWSSFWHQCLSFKWLAQATVLSYTTLFILMPTMAFLVNCMLHIGIDIGNQDLWLITLSRDLPIDTQNNLLNWWHQILTGIKASSSWLIFFLLISQWITSFLIQQTLQSFWPKRSHSWYHLPKLISSLFWVLWAFGLQIILIFGGWVTTWLDDFAFGNLAVFWTSILHFTASWLLFTGVLWFSAPIKKPRKVFLVALIMSGFFVIINHLVSMFMEHSFTFSLTFGSFSFMPMLMIWLECIWSILILGVLGLACYNQS